MSIVERHDVIQTSLVISDTKKRIKAIEEDKHAWEELNWQQRAEVVKNLRMLHINGERQKANTSIDHQKMIKAEYTETWTGSFGSRQMVNKKTGRKMTATFKADGDEVEDKSLIDIRIYPQMLAGYQALKTKYQYFKINKVSIKFVANSANNLSPIVCRYMPPFFDVSKMKTLDPAYMTKYAESAGSNYGYISIHTPACIIKKGEYSKNGFSTEKGFVMPNLCKDRMLCKFEELGMFLDYGYFIFETRNVSDKQSIIAQISYQIDFYTGYDYEAAENVGANIIEEGEESEGGDVPPGPDEPDNPDDPDDPSEGGDPGDGDGDTEDDGSTIPDQPSGNTKPSGQPPKGRSGFVSKKFKK